MAYNSTHPKYKSTGPGGGLKGLDCGYNLKFARAATVNGPLIAIFDTPSTGMEKGTCVAMIRVPAGTMILGGSLAWSNGGASGTGSGGLGAYTIGTAPLLGVGDPFACCRLMGACCATHASGFNLGTSGSVTCCTMTKTGSVGDGCGIGYTYTCETDIIVTNLDHDGLQQLGGWAGSVAAPSSILGATATGRIILTLIVAPV